MRSYISIRVFLTFFVCLFSQSVFASFFLSVDNTKTAVDDTVATLSSTDGLSLADGSDTYYTIDGAALKLTAAGAAIAVDRAEGLPTAVITDGSTTEYLITRHATPVAAFTVDADSPSVTDDSAVTENLHSVSNGASVDTRGKTNQRAVLQFSLDDVAQDALATLHHVNLGLFTLTSTFDQFADDLLIKQLLNDDWTESSLVIERVIATKTKKYLTESSFDSLFNRVDAAQDTYTSSDYNVVFESANNFRINQLGSADFGSAISLAMQANVEGGVETVRYRFYSESDDNYYPYLSATYSTTTPNEPQNDVISVNEGGNNLTALDNLLDNDFSILPASTQIYSVNSVAWDSLSDSTEALYAASQGFKQISGSHGTLYLQQDGSAFYQHGGADVATTVVDSFTYKISSDSAVSEAADIDVTISAANQVPEIALREKNFHYTGGTANVSTGDVVATISINDPDGDTLAVYWTNGSSPVDVSSNALYEINAGKTAITFTQAGADAINSGADMAEIQLSVVDLPTSSSLSAKVAFDKATPYVASASVYFIDQANGSDSYTGTSLNTAFASPDGLPSLAAGDTVYIVGTYESPNYDEDFFDTWDPTDISNVYLWTNNSALIFDGLTGSSSDPIVIKGLDENAIIKSHGVNAILIDNSTHVTVQGLSIDGLANDVTVSQLKPMHWVYRVDNTAVDYAQAENISYVNSFFKHVSGFDYFFEATPTEAAVETILTAQSLSTADFGLDDILVTQDDPDRVTLFDIDPSSLSGVQLASINLTKVANATEDLTVRENNMHYADSFIKSDGVYDYYYRLPPDSTQEYIEHYYNSDNGVLPTGLSGQKPSIANNGGINVRDSEHVTVKENEVASTGAPAISGVGNEYVNITDNVVANATGRMFGGSMGVVLRDLRDTDSTDNYKAVIANNKVSKVFNEYWSYVFSKDFVEPALDEGKGISLEFESFYLDAPNFGRILLAGNETWLNGVSGVNVHNGSRVDLVNNTSYLSSVYATVWGLGDGSANNIGITTVQDDSTEDGYDNNLLNNLGIVDGNLNGNAVTAMPEFRDGLASTDADGSNNSTATVTGGSISYNDVWLADLDFYLASGTDLQISNGNVIEDYETIDLRPADASVLDGAGINPETYLSALTSDPIFGEVLTRDVNGVVRDLDALDVGALESYVVRSYRESSSVPDNIALENTTILEIASIGTFGSISQSGSITVDIDGNLILDFTQLDEGTVSGGDTLDLIVADTIQGSFDSVYAVGLDNFSVSVNVLDASPDKLQLTFNSLGAGDVNPPVVNAPAGITVAATDANGTAASHSSIAAFLNAATANDDVDGSVAVTNNAPSVFPLGVTTVTFSATDSASNTGSAQASVTVTTTRDGYESGSETVAGSATATVPDAPTGVTATAGRGEATVSWTAPASNGGAEITGYTVTASPGGATCTTTGATSCTVPGLTNGTAYTFTVTATNSAGTGTASAASASVTPAIPPNAPTSVSLSGNTLTLTAASGGTIKILNNGVDVTSKFMIVENSGTYTAVAKAGEFNGESVSLTATVTVGGVEGAASSPAVTGTLDTTNGDPESILKKSDGSTMEVDPEAVIGDFMLNEDGSLEQGKRIYESGGSADYIQIQDPSTPDSDIKLRLENASTASNTDPAEVSDIGVMTFYLANTGNASGSGFAPGSTAEVWLFSDPIYLGETPVLADGTWSLEFDVPDDLATGNHTIQAQGTLPNGRAKAASAGVVVSQATGDPGGAGGALPVPTLPMGLLMLVAVLLGGLGLRRLRI